MAITTNTVSDELILVFDNGTSTSGKALTKNLVLRNIKPSSSNDDVYAVAQSVNSLIEKTNLAVQKRSLIEIVQE